MKCSKCDREMTVGRVVSYCKDCRESDDPANREILDVKRGLSLLAKTAEFTIMAVEKIMLESKVPEDLVKILEECLENGRMATRVALRLADTGFTTPTPEEKDQIDLFPEAESIDVKEI